MSKRKKKWLIIGGVVVGVLAAVILTVALALQPPKAAEGQVWQPVETNEENIGQFLGSLSVVQEIPDEGSVEIALGNQIFEASDGSFKQGSSGEAEVKVWLPEEYIEALGQNPCGAIRHAVENGHVRYDSSLSASELAWKYRDLLKYKECFAG